MENLSTKQYKNEFVASFTGDESGNLQPRQTPGKMFSLAKPTPVKKVTLLAWSDELAQQLGIEKPETENDLNILGGNLLAPTMKPYAACYAGHQFGGWAGQLGDGRAITLGEWNAANGKTYELQLKGAGPTPYSRSADGRAVLRSSVREYLMSEAMYYLGVPTTRALSLVTTGEKVMRDMFYNGHPEFEPGAIVMRVARSFLRFGNFEMPAARGEIDNLRKLVDWTIEKHYPHITGDDKILKWFKEVIERTATLMVEWMRVGFVHGVMNTDNMSILGVTIDYGPYSFVDDYDFNFTPNTTDLPGRRYAFGQQPAVAKWNLGCLANAIAPLFTGTEELVAALDSYDGIYWNRYFVMMANKLGIDKIDDNTISIVTQLEELLNTVKPDMTIFFQQLIEFDAASNENEIMQHFENAFYHQLKEAEEGLFLAWVEAYKKVLAESAYTREQAKDMMRRHNPRFVLRNYLLHQAIEGLEKGDNTLFEKLQQAIKEPYAHNFDEFFAKRPDWASQKAGCSMLSCSS